MLMLTAGWLLLGGEALVANAENRSPLISPNAVEDVARRTKFSKTYDNGDGTFTDEYSIRPIHFLDEQGNWQDVEVSTVYKRAAVALEDSFLCGSVYKKCLVQAQRR